MTATGTMTGTMATGIDKDSGNRAGHWHSVSDRLQRSRFDECHNKYKEKQVMKKLIACLAAVLVSTIVMAETKLVSVPETRPFNLSLTPDVSVYGRNATIEGMTLSIWGQNPQKSFALGLVNGTADHSVGFSLGILNYADYYKGLQLGLVNYTKEDSTGFLGGFFGFIFSGFNYTGGTMRGLYTGVVNYAGRLKGLELGIVNYVDESDSGFQIGLLNIIHNNKSWFSNFPSELAPWMILVNWRF